MTGIVIGRFQVPELHVGHRALLRHVMAKCDKMVVFIGVAPFILTKRNPLTLDMVKYSVKEFLRTERYKNALVVPLPDQRTDETWSNRLDVVVETLTHGSDFRFYSDRDGFTSHYCGKHKDKIEVVDLKIKASGTQLRKALVASPHIPEFREGVVWAIENQYPLASVCVDAIVVNQTKSVAGPSYLLVKKRGESLFRFPGGFVDPEDTSLEHAVRRELAEETVTQFTTDPVYLFSMQVKDWRSSLITSVFELTATAYGGPLWGNEEIEKQTWMFAMDGLVDKLIPEHKPIWEKYIGK